MDINMLGIVLVIGVSTGLAMLPGTMTRAQHCSTVKYAMNLRTCFNIRRDIVDTIMIHNKDTVVEISLQAEGFLYDPKHVCDEKKTFTDLYNCLGGITSSCPIAEASKDYLPSANLTKQGLNDFCAHIEDVDTACYNESYRKVFECVQTLSAENLKSNDSIVTKACRTVDITHDCIHAKVQCNDTTRDMLLKFHDVYRKPSGCAMPTRSDRKHYITSPGGPTDHGVAVVVSRVFCFCLSFIVILMTQT